MREEGDSVLWIISARGLNGPPHRNQAWCVPLHSRIQQSHDARYIHIRGSIDVDDRGDVAVMSVSTNRIMFGLWQRLKFIWCWIIQQAGVSDKDDRDVLAKRVALADVVSHATGLGRCDLRKK